MDRRRENENGRQTLLYKGEMHKQINTKQEREKKNTSNKEKITIAYKLDR